MFTRPTAIDAPTDGPNPSPTPPASPARGGAGVVLVKRGSCLLQHRLGSPQPDSEHPDYDGRQREERPQDDRQG